MDNKSITAFIKHTLQKQHTTHKSEQGVHKLHLWYASCICHSGNFPILGASSSTVCTSRDHFLFCFFWLFFFFLSPDFHELWHSMTSTCLITEVKQQWATLVVEWVTASVHYSCLWWPCGSRYSTETPSALLKLTLSLKLQCSPVFCT